ncbi:dehalogenase [Dehalococcoides mccartyi]|uniref:Dehalogenase n=1 Tax=Dehalococcoides mccartyi TaxID=61435 RepID=A0A0V8LXD4_9CHLR|nr:dehalogenase [Dehalococcoides mccartyi]
MWATISLLIGLGFARFIQYLKVKAINIKWYEWIIGISGLLLILFCIQNSIAGFAEREPKSAWMFMVIIGLPGLILLGVARSLVTARQKRTPSI